MPRRRTPQLWDDCHLELRLPSTTPDEADAAIRGGEDDFCFGDVERTDKALIVRHVIGGNCDGIANVQSWFHDLEDALREVDVQPLEFTLKVTSKEPTRGS